MARWWNYFSKLLNVNGVKDVGQAEIHTAEPLVLEPSASEVELAIEKLKSHKSSDINQIPEELINPLTPNDPYSGRTAPLTSKRCILYIYLTNIGTEYFKHGIYSIFFSSKWSLFHNSNVFGSCIIYISYTGLSKIKKK